MRALSRIPWIAVVLLVMPTAAMAGPANPEKVAQILALAVLLVVAIPALATTELLIMALLPGPVGAARNVLVRQRLACLVAGAAVLVMGLLLVAVLGKVPGLGQLLAVLIAAALILGVVLGFPAIGLLAGRAVLEMSGRTPSTLASAAWGLVLILFGSLFPVLGWALFAFLCLAALGAVVLALFEMRRSASAADAEITSALAAAPGEPDEDA